MNKLYISIICNFATICSLRASEQKFSFYEVQKNGTFPLELISRFKDINAASTDGFTLLTLAISIQDIQATNALLLAGADPNKAGTNGMNPLGCACYVSNDKIVERLLHYGADCNKSSKDGNTPLHIAATNGNNKIVKRLLYAGADPNKAIVCGRHQFGQLFFKIDTENQFQECSTPLCGAACVCGAAWHNTVRVVRTLLAAGADCNKTDCSNYTPHMLATQRQNHKTANLLERWPHELKPLFLTGLRVSCCAFLAANHARCGINTAIQKNAIPQDIMQYICIFLKPENYIYSWKNVKHYIAIANKKHK